LLNLCDTLHYSFSSSKSTSKKFEGITTEKI